jgi:branched-chain amino acid transport system permease protein
VVIKMGSIEKIKLMNIKKYEWSIFASAIAAPFVLRFSPYIQSLLVFVLIWVIMGMSWNILAGYTGLVSFGHAAYFGIGAYAAAIPFLHWGISPWWGLLTGGISAIILGYVIGIIVFRLRGPYFALGTLATAEILRIIFGEEIWLTNGHTGILYMTTWVSKYPYYFIALALATGAIISVKIVMKSKAGYYFLSIREDEEATQALGVNTKKYKNIAMLISTFWAGMAGAFYMIYVGFIDPEIVFSLYNISIITILVGIIGGVGTIWGPAVGAIIMVLVQELFRSAFFGLAPEWISNFHPMVFGLLAILIILYAERGVVGDWKLIRGIFQSRKFLEKKV